MPDNTPHRKDIVIGTMTVYEDLRLADKLRNIDDVESLEEVARALNPMALEDESFERDGPESVSFVKCFYNQLDRVPGATHMFQFPLTVTRNNKSNEYMFLFSTRRANDSSPFPGVMCTLDQFDSIMAKIQAAEIKMEILPQHTEKDKAIMADYERAERGIDRLTRYVFEKGLARELPDKVSVVETLLKNIRVNVVPGDLTPIQARRIYLVSARNQPPDVVAEFERLRAASVVRIVDSDGNEHFVVPDAHSSNHSIYIYTPNVNPALVHEFGAICGQPVDGNLKNDMDKRYAVYLKNPAANENEWVSRAIVDLDTNLATRDQASGDPYEEAGRLAAPIIKAWPLDKNETDNEFDNPFGKEAKARYDKIIEATRSLTGHETPFKAEIWYRICFARLFGAGDHKYVLSFFTWLKNLGIRKAHLKDTVLTDENFLLLFFAARAMDRETLQTLTDAGAHFMRGGLEYLYTGEPQLMNKLHGINIDNLANRIWEVVYESITFYIQENKFDEAAALIENIELYFTNEVSIDPSGKDKYAAARDALKRWRGDVVRNKRLYGLATRIARHMVENGLAAGKGPWPGYSAEMKRIIEAAVRRCDSYLDVALAGAIMSGGGESLTAEELRTKACDVQGLPGSIDEYLASEVIAMSSKLTGESLEEAGLIRQTTPISPEEAEDLLGDVSRYLYKLFFDHFGASLPDLPKTKVFIDMISDSAVKIAGEQSPVEKAYRILPREYLLGPLSYSGLEAELRTAGLGDISGLDSKTALIFSEKTAFDKGLAVLLPKLANAGIRVAVVLSDIPDKKNHQQNIITVLNYKVDGGKPKIAFGERFSEIREKMGEPGVGRYRYFRVKEDKDDSLIGVDNNSAIDIFDITRIINSIIDAIGLASHVPSEMLPALHRAVEKLAAAA